MIFRLIAKRKQALPFSPVKYLALTLFEERKEEEILQISQVVIVVL